MIRRTLLALGLLLLSAGVSLAAANLNGRWEGSINTPNGDVDLVFHFNVSGAVLTGTVETPNGNADIADGKVDGDKFSFKTHAGDSEISHEGTISGDTIQLKVSGPWGDTDMTLKRAAEGKSAKP
jgi:hypothetical protein